MDSRHQRTGMSNLKRTPALGAAESLAKYDPLANLFEPFDMACMMFCSAFLGSYEEPGWRDIDMHLPHCGQTS